MFECLLIFTVVLALFTVAVRSTAGGESGRLRRRSYQQIAKQFSGVAMSRGLFSAPSVRFRYGETVAFLTETSARGPYRGRCTQVQIAWSDPKFRAEFCYNGRVAREVNAFSMPYVSSGDEDFDRKFVMRGDSEEDMRHFLSDGVRWQIDRLVNLFGPGQLYILITHGRIFIQKPQLIRRFSDLKQFLERSLELYDQAMITRAVGIEFVNDGEAQALDHVICKVCGDEIVSDMVYCQRCKTPHHGDCWQYTGTCSVYGCQERAYARPQPAAPSVHPHAASHDRVEHAGDCEGQ